MSKIIQSVTVLIITLCLALTFVGCSEKERKTADINALNSVIKTTYVDFFDENGEFVVKYSESVNKLILNNEKVALLNDYLGVIAKNSYSFFNLTANEITDKDWSKSERIEIYNNLKSVKNSLNDLKNTKDRFEIALQGYESGDINNIQNSNLTNYIKEYGDAIYTLQKFQNNYINTYFKTLKTDFYNYQTSKVLKANDLKIILAHKSFDIAKASMDLEYKYYFEIDNAKFRNEVKANNTTKLCEELNKLDALKAKITTDITDLEKKQKYLTINNSEKYFDRQMQIFKQAIDDFDFKKMRKSDETEESYVSKQSLKKQKQYEDTMYIAYDYIPQMVVNYQTVFNAF